MWFLFASYASLFSTGITTASLDARPLLLGVLFFCPDPGGGGGQPAVPSSSNWTTEVSQRVGGTIARQPGPIVRAARRLW